MMLTKNSEGLYVPSYNADKVLSDKIKVGSEVYASKRRNPEFHRKGMKLLQMGFDNQDKFDEFEIYRQVITMRAGFVSWVSGTDGKEHPLPKSLSFDKMNSEEFEKWYNAIKVVIAADCKINGNDIEFEIKHNY